MISQIAVRIPDALQQQLDELVASGRYATRAQAVRAGLEMLVEQERQRAIDEAIAEGYRRHPPSRADERWVDTAGRELIAEEPW